MAEPDVIAAAEAAASDDLGVQEFLDAMGVAVTAGDGEAIAEMWETPAFVLSEEMADSIDDPKELAMFFSGAKAQYNARGIADTRAEIVRLDEISDRIVSVRVRWPWLDAQGREVGGETSTYTLKRDDGGEWKLRIAVMHGPEAVN